MRKRKTRRKKWWFCGCEVQVVTAAELLISSDCHVESCGTLRLRLQLIQQTFFKFSPEMKEMMVLSWKPDSEDPDLRPADVSKLFFLRDWREADFKFQPLADRRQEVSKHLPSHLIKLLPVSFYTILNSSVWRGLFQLDPHCALRHQIYFNKTASILYF